jgi:hypothetical protein
LLWDWTDSSGGQARASIGAVGELVTTGWKKGKGFDLPQLCR